MTAALLVEKYFFNRQAIAALRGVALDRLRDDYGRVVFVASTGAQTQCFTSLELFDEWFDGLAVTPAIASREGAS